MLGLTAFALGAAALLLVLLQLWAGPFAPRQSAPVTIGETAAQIRQAAQRALAGAPPPAPAPAAWDIDRLLAAATAGAAGLALVLAAAALIRREDWRPAAAGLALAGGAVAVQIATWAILVIAGAILLYAILSNLDSILGG
jgi:hypothetical protein